MKRSATGKGARRLQRTAATGAAMVMLASGSLAGLPVAGAVDPPVIDPAALPPDGTPGPLQTMRQTSYCTEVSVRPGTDFRVQPGYMDMLNLPEAWKFGRGAGVTVAVIDTGVTPHPRLPNLDGGGDYVMAGGDGLSDCDAHGTLVASLIAAMPDNGVTPLPPAHQTRRPPTVPTNEPQPTVPAPQTTIMVVPPSLPAPVPLPVEGDEPAPAPEPGAGVGPPPGPPPGPGAASSSHTTVGDSVPPARPADFSHTAAVAPVDFRAPSAPPPSNGPDAFSGIAPDVHLLSIRQYSAAFSPKEPFGAGHDPQLREKTDGLRTLARAIVHAANLGASVINISSAVCMNVRNMLDQADLGAAVQYAAVEKNAVIVAAAGDTGWRDCKQNPSYDAMHPDDPRDWNGVNTVVTPAWYDQYVLTVGAVDAQGAPLNKVSVSGPWVSIAAPGTDIEGLSARDDGLMNAVDGPDNTLLTPQGTSFSTAIVSGVVALVRAKYPELSSYQVINRMIRTARPPARGVDDAVGYGVVDPVAALTWDVPDASARPPERLSAPLQVPPMPPERDMKPALVAGAGLLAALVAAGVALGVAALRRSSRNR